MLLAQLGDGTLTLGAACASVATVLAARYTYLAVVKKGPTLAVAAAVEPKLTEAERRSQDWIDLLDRKEAELDYYEGEMRKARDAAAVERAARVAAEAASAQWEAAWRQASGQIDRFLISREFGDLTRPDPPALGPYAGE